MLYIICKVYNMAFLQVLWLVFSNIVFSFYYLFAIPMDFPHATFALKLYADGMGYSVTYSLLIFFFSLVIYLRFIECLVSHK